jgi:hypothetical protein
VFGTTHMTCTRAKVLIAVGLFWLGSVIVYLNSDFSIGMDAPSYPLLRILAPYVFFSGVSLFLVGGVVPLTFGVVRFLGGPRSSRSAPGNRDVTKR